MVYSPDFGWITAFGYDHDLDALELLAASLLAQATDAQVVATTAGEHDRLLPVPSAREERLRVAERAAFPTLARRRASVSNGAGRAAGQVAADLADLDVSAGALRGTDAGADPPLC